MLRRSFALMAKPTPPIKMKTSSKNAYGVVGSLLTRAHFFLGVGGCYADDVHIPNELLRTLTNNDELLPVSCFKRPKGWTESESVGIGVERENSPVSAVVKMQSIIVAWKHACRRGKKDVVGVRNTMLFCCRLRRNVIVEKIYGGTAKELTYTSQKYFRRWQNAIRSSAK